MLKDHHPQQQGLRPVNTASNVRYLILKDHHPQQQGLRQSGLHPERPLAQSQRPSSTTTRIKTSLLPAINLATGISQRPSSTTTRIKTPV